MKPALSTGWTLVEAATLLTKVVAVRKANTLVGIGRVSKVSQSIKEYCPSLWLSAPSQDWVEVDMTNNCEIHIIELPWVVD